MQALGLLVCVHPPLAQSSLWGVSRGAKENMAKGPHPAGQTLAIKTRL
eukprot:COSAG01_NODE_13299_length_1604_cov_40.065781_2_plen_47_part_01